MGEVDEVQEWIKADIEAQKEQMDTMMEVMMSMKKMMEVNEAAVATTSAVAEVDPIPPSGLDQIIHPTLDMVGQGGKELGSTGAPHFVQVQNEHPFQPYSLPPNYTPPNVVHTPDENVNNSTPIITESQQPQSDHAHVPQPMEETHEIPHHNLADFEPCLEYTTEGQTVGGVPLPNTLEGPQFCTQPQSLHIAVGRVPLAMLCGYSFHRRKDRSGSEKSKFDYPASMNRKPGANREDEKEEGTHVVTVIPMWPNFPPAQQCHYSANINPSHYPPPSHPQRSSLNQPQSLPAVHPMPNTTLNTNQNTN
ncbi:hypothetical protein HKD37_06G016614 [Glycine soja]